MRRARLRAKSGYYHIVIRGVNKQNIFFSTEDKEFFKKLLKKYGRRFKMIFHTYVLMDNHVHLLIEDPLNLLSEFIQIVASVYARYFNKKYDRIGHLYQDRFASEVIERNGYLVVVFRYILLNPQKAGICKANKYRWSSYNAYKKKDPLISTEKILSIFGSVENIYKYLEEKNDDECLDISLRPSEKEFAIVNKIKKLLKTENPIINPELSKKEISAKINLLRKNGISIRAISRITGISRGFIQYA